MPLNDDATAQPVNDNNDLGNPDSPYPGRRLKNPLGYLASYAYKWTIYLVTPQVYNAFVLQGCRDIPNKGAGAYPIVSSGGINEADNLRADSIPFDYFIESVNISTLTASSATQGGPLGFDFKMKIVEPMGFSLINNLKRLEREVESKHGLPRTSFIKHHFLAEVLFRGWDVEGNLVKGSDTFDGRPIDPYGTDNSLFRRVFDVKFAGLQFQLGTPKGTVYDLKFIASHREATGPKMGWIDQNITLKGKTVDENLKELVENLNAWEQKKVEEGTKDIPHVYSYSYAADGGQSASIGSAIMVDPADLEKIRYPMGEQTNVTDVNDASSAETAPDDVTKPITRNGQSIIQTIDDIIKNSDYMRAALTKLLASKPEPTPPQEGEFKMLENDTQRALAWYTVSVNIATKGVPQYDEKVKDWAYYVDYQITKMYTPVIIAAYVGEKYSYFGPHKRYEYLFTGKNTDIISYTQNFNNLFYLIAFKDDEGAQAAPDANVSVAPGKNNPPDNQGAQGPGQQAQNAMLTSLYDPSAYAKATIRLLGDPDFLCAMHQQNSSSVDIGDTASAIYNHFYQDAEGGDQFQINPQGSQVFIEVDFKEGVDYQQDGNGLLDINTSIQFWEYPEELVDTIKGIAYRVWKVDHSFSAGKYEMTLSLIPAVFPKGGVLRVLNEDGTETEVDTGAPRDENGDPVAPAAGADDDQGGG